jgi:hypothetical protein
MPDVAASSQSVAVSVAGPRIRPIVKSAYERLDLHNEKNLPEQVAEIAARLSALGLGDSVAFEAHLLWSAEALARSVPSSPALSSAVSDLKSYRSLRAAQPARSAALMLAEAALKLAAAADAEVEFSPVDLEMALGEQSATVSEPLAASDLDQVEAAVQGLEAWWAQISTEGGETEDGETDVLMEVLFEERALLRFALESQLIAYVFPAARARASALRERIASLHDEVVATLRAERGAAADALWESLLGDDAR